MYRKVIRELKGKSLIEDLSDYTVVDIETTGMNWNFCNILEISSLKVRNKEVVEEFSELINQHEPIPYFIRNLTGITDEMVYNAPELKNHYCCEVCPLGRNWPKVELESLDRISIKALSTFRKISTVKESLLDIVEDGVITVDEKPALDEVLKTLDEVTQVAQNLKVWIEKNMR